MLKPFLKKVTLISTIGVFLVHSTLIRFFVVDSKKRRKFFTKNTSRYSRFVLPFLGVTVRLNRDKIPATSHLIVSNHLSYLDVQVISSIFPTLFVTSKEVQSTPLLGSLAESAGSLFVERRNRNNICNEIGEITEALKQGFSVVVFPEATSTNGDKVIPFKKSLFQSAIDSNTAVLPLCINYVSLDKKPLTRENRDQVFYYGDHEFSSHFSNLFRLNLIEIEIEIGEPIPVDASLHVRDLSENAFTQISALYKGLDAHAHEFISN